MNADPGQFIDAEVIKERLDAIEVKIDQLTGCVEALQASLDAVIVEREQCH